MDASIDGNDGQRIPHGRDGVKRNFQVLLLQGTVYTAAIQLTSVATVIPYICAELNGPNIVVALVVPIFTVGYLYGTAFSTWVLRWRVSVATLIAGTAVVMGVLTAANATDVSLVPPTPAVYVLLVIAVLIGIASGCSVVTYQLAISTLLTPQRRSDLLLRTAGFGAAVLTALAAFSAAFLSDDSPGLDDAELLWIGTGAMVLAAVCCAGMRSTGHITESRPTRIRDMLHEGAQYFRDQRWHRRYVLVQLVFTVVIASPTFYGIYSANSLGPDNGDLDTLLIFIGCGMLAGIVIWTAVRKRFGTRGMYLGSATISVAAALGCIVSQAFHLLPAVWTFGLAMLLAAVANQAIYPAAQDWIFGETTEDVRVSVLGFSQIITSSALIVTGFVYGIIADHGPAIWPLGIVLAIACLAVVAATRAPTSTSS